MNDELIKINEKMSMLRQEIAELKVMLRNVVESQSKMDNHVDFVETVYESVRHPLSFIKSKFEWMTAVNSKSATILPPPPTKCITNE